MPSLNKIYMQIKKDEMYIYYTKIGKYECIKECFNLNDKQLDKILDKFYNEYANNPMDYYF